MPGKASKKKVAAGAGASEEERDRQEAEQGAALLQEALLSFRSQAKPQESSSAAPPAPLAGIVEAPEMSPRSLLKHTLSGGEMPSSLAPERPPAATIVHLIGKLPVQENSFALGMYVRSVDMHDGRHVYSSEGKHSLWYALPPDEFSGGSWYVGPTEVVGQRTGFLRVTQNTDVPEEISATWQVYSTDGEWVAAPELKAITDEVFEAEAQKHLAGAAGAVSLSGATSDGKDTAAFGVLTRSVRHESRFRYINEGSFALWFVSGTWFVGDIADAGTRSAFLMAEDDAYLPEKIAATWKVHAGREGWVDAPEVHVTTE
jgi:hypothetical protein